MKARTKRAAIAGATGLIAALLMTGCAPGGVAPAKTAATSDVSKDVANAGDVTLKLSDFWGSTEEKWVVKLIDQFEKKYPNVKIERTGEDWGQLTSTLNLQLQDESGPDISTANNGWSSLGTLAKGHLVLNLDSYAKLYGWKSEVPTTIARQNEFTTDFTKVGEGSWFSTPVARTSLIGVYYNADKLKALGVKPPKTLKDLEKAATKAKEAGEIPFSYSGVDGNTAVLLGLQALYGSEKHINGFVYGGQVSAEKTGLTKAATTLKEWNKKGWLTPNFEGIDYQTSLADFVDGKGVFRFEYTGSLGLSGDQLNKFGYIQLPQVSGDGTVGVGAAPAAMVISSKSKHPDVAAAFLDFLMSKQAAQDAAELGLVPMLDSTVKTPNTLSQRDEAAAAKTLDSNDGYVPYFDWSSPTMLDTISQNTQLLLAGKMTSEAFSTAVDVDRTKFLTGS